MNTEVKLDPSFKYRLSSNPGGESITSCFACGVCTAACPVNTVNENFNPRKMIKMILLGEKEEILNGDLIWYCILCERCFANCPQNVNFAHVTRALRDMAVKEGYADSKLPEMILDIDRLTHKARKGILEKILKNKNKIGKIDLVKIFKEVVNSLP